MSTSIKNKIASFEAHNELIRKTTPDRGRSTQAVASTSSTATSKASQSRRSRIKREVSNSPAPERAPPVAPEAGGLKERRKQRQEQQRERLGLSNKEKSSSSSSRPLPSANRTSSSLARGSSKPKPSSSSSRSQRPSTTTKKEPRPEGNRRFVNTVSTESDDGDQEYRLSPRDEKLAKVKRMQRMRRSRSPLKKAEREAIMMKESETYFNKLLTPNMTDEDELTETSVRQIMKEDDKRRPVMTRASSSSFDTEGDSINQMTMDNTATGSFLLSRSDSTRMTPASSFSRTEDDDRTYDYGDRDDDGSDGSQGSITFEQRKEMERKAREQEERAKDEKISPLLNKDDMEFIGKNLDTPVAKTAAGVIVAASVGAIVLGPVGLLVGAAAVGLGVGIMQIPEEQRKNVQDKATHAINQAKDSCINASEKLTATCGATCQDLGVTEHIPADLVQCFPAPDGDNSLQDENEDIVENGQADGAKTKGVEKVPGGKKVAHVNGHDRNTASPARAGQRRAAVLRQGRITPLPQIYSLEPSLQPRAWLDVMASAETTSDEKNEALEEIVILAKDKRHARFFLDEGILDSLMWMLHPYVQGPRKPEDMKEASQIKLAATCCVTLGKAHCAAVHTGGDLLLMSMYERGSVPEERQLAQMLYEVPHHVQVAKSIEVDEFVLKTLTMPQAEELARSISALATGQQPGTIQHY